MIEIKDLLGRYDKILSSSEYKKDSIRQVISKVIGVNIDSSQIDIKNQTVFLNIKPIYKSEILLKRDKINTLLDEILGKKAPGEIR